MSLHYWQNMSIAKPLPVSVVVNTVDRAKPLATLLAALEHQSYSHFEVIVVVGPTRDQTLAVLEQYAGRMRVLRCAHANLSESRNIGLLAARGEIVAFIDDDAVPSHHWLAQIVAAFGAAEANGHDVAIVGGSVYMVHPQQTTIQHWQGIMSDLGEQHDVRHDEWVKPEGMGVFWTERPMGANMAFRRRTLLAEGGFDEYYQWVFDDADVAMRLALAGYGVCSLTEAPVYHAPASSRNRVVRTFSGRWWIITQASTYFAVQNGRAAGQPAPQVLLRVLHLIHGAWLVNGELRRAGHINRRAMWARRLRAMTAGAQGALQGLGRRRVLARTPAPASAAANHGAPGHDAILPFLRPQSVDAPSIDPVSGALGAGPWARPTLRIGLIAQPFVAPADPAALDQLATMTQALFQMGHAVHVLTTAERRIVYFRDGAFIHAELLPGGEDALVAGVRRLVENDGIQFLVGAPADLAAAAALGVVQARQAVAQPAVAQPGCEVSLSQHSVLPEAVRQVLAPLLAAGHDVAAIGHLESRS